MSIIFSNSPYPINWPISEAYDPNDSKIYRIDYAPQQWTASTAYTQNLDLVTPTIPNGCMYTPSNGGISGLVEPIWQTFSDYQTQDNQILWDSQPYTTLLKPGDVITASTWAASIGAVIDSQIIIAGIATQVRLTAVAVGATSVTLTNTLTITRLTGDVEILDHSIVIPVINA